MRTTPTRKPEIVKVAELARRPKHLANAGLAYQITEKLGADVNVSYTGKRMDTYYSPTYSTHKSEICQSYTFGKLRRKL